MGVLEAPGRLFLALGLGSLLGPGLLRSFPLLFFAGLVCCGLSTELALPKAGHKLAEFLGIEGNITGLTPAYRFLLASLALGGRLFCQLLHHLFWQRLASYPSTHMQDVHTPSVAR
jgi:hypothetical protein